MYEIIEFYFVQGELRHKQLHFCVNWYPQMTTFLSTQVTMQSCKPQVTVASG